MGAYRADSAGNLDANPTSRTRKLDIPGKRDFHPRTHPTEIPSQSSCLNTILVCMRNTADDLALTSTSELASDDHEFTGTRAIKQFESIRECAARYGVTRQTITTSIRRLGIREYRPGPNVIRLDPAEVDSAFATKSAGIEDHA